MISYNRNVDQVLQTSGKEVQVFSIENSKNIDEKTVKSFGEEWLKFNNFSASDIEQIGRDYFDILPQQWDTNNAVALDMGCGTGRWAYYLSRKFGFVECVDPSEAVFAASQLLKEVKNVRISRADVDSLPFEDNSFDLVYSLGVLHHIPDTFAAMEKCVSKVKPGGYFLVYLYYNLDNRARLYKVIFRASNALRGVISHMPSKAKKVVCDLIAISVYFPLAKFAGIIRKVGMRSLSKKLPLSYYSDKSFWIMKNDALDRFGTPLEQRFSKEEIRSMMERCGLTNIVFSDSEPYWHAIGQKK